MTKNAVPSLLALSLLLAACSTNGMTPEVDAPASPSNVVATPGPGYVMVTWEDNSDDETGFVIYRDTAGGAGLRVQALEPVGEVPADAEEFVDRSVEPGVEYVYAVAAEGAEGSSASVQAASSITVEAGIDLAVGTYNFAPIIPVPQTALAFYFFLPQNALPNEAVTLTVEGPAGWNDGAPFEVTFPAEGIAAGFAWTPAFVPVVAGDYTVTATIGGTEYSATAATDATGVLPPPENVTITSSSSESVALDWDPVPGAASYGGIVYDTPLRIGANAFGGGNTTETSIVLDDLDLPYGEYLVIVFAYPIDRTAQRPLKPDEFNVALAATDHFSVVAAACADVDLDSMANLFIPVDHNGSYLEMHPDDDEVQPPTSVTLADLGISEGECIGLEVAGGYSYGGDEPDDAQQLAAVFSGSEGFVSASGVGDVETGTCVEEAFASNDIPEDFDASSPIYLEVPAGAEELLFSPLDCFVSDNLDPNDDFGVVIRFQ